MGGDIRAAYEHAGGLDPFKSPCSEWRTRLKCLTLAAYERRLSCKGARLKATRHNQSLQQRRLQRSGREPANKVPKVYDACYLSYEVPHRLNRIMEYLVRHQRLHQVDDGYSPLPPI